MLPSSLSTLVIANLTLDVGICAVAFSASCALRMRVSMSAIGSVMLMCSPQPRLRSVVSWLIVAPGKRRSLPAGLDHAGNLAAHRDFAQLVAPQPELAVDAARASSQPAAVAKPRRARVPRQLLQLVPGRQTVLVGEPHIADRRLQLSALLGVLFHRHAAFQIAVDDRLFRHGVLKVSV